MFILDDEDDFEEEEQQYVNNRVGDLTMAESITVLDRYLDYVQYKQDLDTGYDINIVSRTTISNKDGVIFVTIDDRNVPQHMVRLDSDEKLDSAQDWFSAVLDLLFDSGEGLTEKQFDTIYSKMEAYDANGLLSLKYAIGQFSIEDLQLLKIELARLFRRAGALFM